MGIFNFDEMQAFGRVQGVDTATIIVQVEDPAQLSRLQVNHLIAIRSSKVGQALIGMVSKIMRKFSDELSQPDEGETVSMDVVKATLIGTLLDREGERRNVFKRTLESVPEIDSQCFIMTDDVLTAFMGVISGADSGMEHPLCIGKYTINNGALAWLDGNKLFQRHAVIVGSTGSGKSFTVATLLEKIAELKFCNAILFDIHGEYAPITGEGIQHYKIAGPADVPSDQTMFLPYWLLSYEEMLALMLDRSDTNAPNQAKASDKRLNFMFSSAEDLLDFSYMEALCRRLMAPASQGGGIKILDFSEVPSDILPLIVSLLARIVFSVQQWMDRSKLNPLAIFCDEAHLYIPANAQQGIESSSLQSFERIAKEGRKYGIGLVIVSQRPSEVNRTVLSQSSKLYFRGK